MTAGLVSFDRRPVVSRLVLRFAFRLGAAFGFGFGLLMPGMLWPSCWATTAGAEAMQNITTRDKIATCLNLDNRFSITTPLETNLQASYDPPELPSLHENGGARTPKEPEELGSHIGVRARDAELTLFRLVVHLHVA